MAFRIYTKTGDKGQTSLIGGSKVSKADLRIEAYGTVDELNSYIGLCKAIITENSTGIVLQEIQDRLFTIGAVLAVDTRQQNKLALPDLHEKDCALLEQEIDKMELTLTPMKSFILPGGSSSIAQIHITRCVCRRAERCCVRLADMVSVEPIVIKYLNRLSDYLFVLARYIGHISNVPDVPWKPRSG